jgi:nucleoside-diphosphate-sugar epimerase
LGGKETVAIGLLLRGLSIPPERGVPICVDASDKHLHMLDATNQSDQNRRAADRSHPPRTGGGTNRAATSILTGISVVANRCVCGAGRAVLLTMARYARAISRIVVIGATGHVGSYLVPRLVRGGHEVVALSRGARDPYVSAPEWRLVERVAVDREAEDAAGVFGGRIAALAGDAVVDMLCFTPESAQQLVEALRPTRPLLMHCGTIWVHGPVARVPVTEDEPRTAYGEYGTGKAAIEALLHRETLAGGVPSVVLHPGHISGPWPVITPAGNLDLDVWRRLATSEPLPLPDFGLGVLHHVHADDVAQAFERALTRPAAIGSSFHVVSEQAMTLRGLAAGVAGWFGREPVLEFVDWAEFERRVGAEHAETSRQHVGRSIAASIDRARDLLGYQPRYSSLHALHESLRWLVANGDVDLGDQDF